MKKIICILLSICIVLLSVLFISEYSKEGAISNNTIQTAAPTTAAPTTAAPTTAAPTTAAPTTTQPTQNQTINQMYSEFMKENDNDKKLDYIPSSNIVQARYDKDNYNVVYHDTEKDIIQQSNKLLNTVDYIRVKDQSGNLVELPWSTVKGNVTYYEPGTFRYGPSNYVPNYEESVYLSKLTGLSYSSPIDNINPNVSGFCELNKINPYELEKNCNKLDTNSCASTSCCVLLGGSKCVSGNANGPIYKTNYSDIYVKNRDKYYYQGKCYGNCK
jgi:hypothetical protein